MQFLQNRPASTTANTKLAHPEKTHTHTHTARTFIPAVSTPPPLAILLLLETQLSSCGGQQMAQAALSYLLLNIICFIHFALQMHSYTWPHSHFSAETIQSPSPFLFYEKRVVRKMLQLFFCLFVFCHLSLNSLLNTCFLFSLFLSLQAS